jgi:hypothetical protein
MSFLAPLHDPAMEVPEGTDAERITAEELERLARMVNVAMMAAEIPRRVGDEASAEELAIDKKRCRRVRHALTGCYKGWSGGNLPEEERSDELRQEAAQIDWMAWWGEHDTWLNNRTRLVVTWCFNNGGDERWAKSAVVKYQNELRWIAYALRE